MSSHSDPVYQGRAVTLLPRVNRKFNATVVGGKARLFMAKDYRERLEALVWSFRVAHHGPPIDHLVDAKVQVRMSKRTDTDAPIKAILDALERAGVIANDRRVRSILIVRKYGQSEEVEVTLYHTAYDRDW